MDKRILFVSDIDKRSIQSGHDLLDLTQIDISYGKSRFALLLVEFDQLLVLEQRNGHFVRGYIND